MAENTNSGGTGNTAIVAIVVLVIVLLVGFFVFYGPGGDQEGDAPDIELNVGGDDSSGSDSGN
jgi:hypothetical protein